MLITLALTAVVAMLLLFCAVFLVQLRMINRRITKFFGTGNDRHDLEQKLTHCLTTVSGVDAKYSDVVESLENLENHLNRCVQKIGIVRYNPFEDMGGDLSFTLALLNARDEGVVLNGIYNRDYAYTYAKPVKALQSKYPLSEEEKDAIKLAMGEGK